jgi:L-alanine-DL-glutamate epimerase-like enolase superfamily enzyme
MKIVKVELLPLVELKLQKELSDAINIINTRRFSGVKVVSDDGLEGISPCLGWSSVVSVIEDIGRKILNMDPFDVEKIWERMYWYTFNFGRKGAPIIAISSIDVAIWDLIGKASNKPVWKLLGGYRSKVKAYGSGINLYWSKDEVIKEALSFVERGFKAYKMKVGREKWEEDIERVKEVRDAIGYSIDLMVDANNSWSVNRAIMMAKRLERYEVAWLEEPVMADDIDGIGEVAKNTSIPIACGETEYTRYGFKDLITRGKISIVQADILKCGGYTEWKKIANFAKAYNLVMAPHANTWLSAQAVASVSNGYIVEVFDIKYPFEYFSYPLRFEDDYIKLQEEAGLGIKVNLENVKKYLAKGFDEGWDTFPPHPYKIS